MDAALLAEREAFKRRAMAVPTIENKKRKTDTGSKGKASSEHNSGLRTSEELLHTVSNYQYLESDQGFRLKDIR
jgi:hypothetical protein